MKAKSPGFRVGSAYATAFSADGEHLAVVGRDVVLWSVGRRRRVRSNRMLRHPSSLAFSPSGRLFAAKNTTGEILVCDTATADPVSRFFPTNDDEGPGPWFRNESELVDGSWASEVRTRNLGDLKPSVLWRREHTMVASLVRAAAVDLWAFTAIAKATAAGQPPKPDHVFVGVITDAGAFSCVPGSWSFVRDIALAPDGETFALRFGTPDHKLAIVKAKSGAQMAQAPLTQGGTGWSTSWSPDGSTIVLVEKGGFSFRDSRDLREMGWLPVQYPASISFAPSGTLIALGSWAEGIVAPWPALLETLRPRNASSVSPAP